MGESTSSRSDKFAIGELHKQVKSGKFRVPEFQRSFRWGAKDVYYLFDSLFKGYPIGNFLLWRNVAPKSSLLIGALEVEAEARQDALWVVDGQQRLTSLVNAIDPEAASRDSRFALSYSLEHDVIRLSRDVAIDEIAIPLVDLFDFGRAFAWLQNNPNASEWANKLQSATAKLNGIEIPCTVIEQGEEETLRDIFDRINSKGKRLNSAEIFDAINSSIEGDNDGFSLSKVLDSINSKTNFGIGSTEVILQALLVRRHPDISRDVHLEFDQASGLSGAYLRETEGEAFQRTEIALLAAVRFLQGRVGVPHMTFLPFRFQLLVYTRFFSYFPEPSEKNLVLLERWFWRSSVSAKKLKLSGRTSDVRMLANLVQPGEENESVQRLLRAVDSSFALDRTIVDDFRSNQSSSKMLLTALWALAPNDPVTNQPITIEEISSELDQSSTPARILLPLFTARDRSLITRVISISDRSGFIESLNDDFDLHSVLLDEQMVELIQNGRREEFENRRYSAMIEYFGEFLASRVGVGLEDTPPLSSLILDED